MQRFLLLGAGGHAAVLYDLLLVFGLLPHGVIDRRLKAGDIWEGLPILGDDDVLSTFSPEDFFLVNGLGANPNCAPRNALYARLRSKGFIFPALVHPSAIIAHNVVLKEGCQIMASSILQSGVTLCENSVINTRSSIDHHCHIGPGTFISPGAILCGSVTIEEGAFIGVGAILLPNVRVGKDAIVGAGAVVLHDVPTSATVAGNPARILSK